MNKKLVEKIEKYKSMTQEELAEKYDCKPSEICMGDYIAKNTKDKKCPYKVIMGFANFEGSDVESLGKLEIVFGKKLRDARGVLLDGLNAQPIYCGINLRGSKITDLGKLKKVYGSIGLNSNIRTLKNLEFLGSSLNLENSNVKDLGKLEVVDGLLYLKDDASECQVTTLGNLRKVRKLVVDSKELKDFGNLEEARVVTLSKKTCNNGLLGKFDKEFSRQSNKYVHVNVKRKDAET